MARRARLQLAGVPLHVIQRGNNRGACFFTDGDRIFYLRLLYELSLKFECAVHAYVLMTNHVHMLITQERVNGVSQLMRHLGQQYVQYVNRAHGRTGSLWEGRFRSSLVDSDSYLLACQRYIELNPVRAGLVGRPDDYAWSSHRVHARGQPDTLVTPHANYMGLGDDDRARQAAYRNLFRLELDSEWLERARRAINAGYPLGTVSFAEQIQLRLGRRTSPDKAGRPRKQKIGVRPQF